MNLRVSMETANAFKAFCHEQHLTQNEGLAALLRSISNKDPAMAENAMLTELQRYKKLNDKLSEKIRALIKVQRNSKSTDRKR